ncbi:RHS repeat-associated core domain-containing protein [Planctomycetota bacterium]
MLQSFNTDSNGVTGPTFTLTDANVDGLGRLTDANETITETDGNSVAHISTYQYDMLSQLTDANISNINSANWLAQYGYQKNGSINMKLEQGEQTDLSYYGHLVTGDNDGNSVGWDLNGRQVTPFSDDPVNYFLEYDWDGRLREGQYGSSSQTMQAVYDPEGVRIAKIRNWNQNDYHHKYVVDSTGELPAILLVLDANNSDAIVKTNIFANDQIIAQHDGNDSNDLYFYMHDRLGSIRQVIDIDANIANYYTYDPWGLVFETDSNEIFFNHYRFAGYIWDDEISQYFCNARQYDPITARFTSRDPINGDFKEPMTLHKYLYGGNDPINNVDPKGETGTLVGNLGAISIGATVTGMVIVAERAGLL